MQARKFRESIAVREEKENYFQNRDIDFIGSYYPNKENWQKKGFFNLYHGIKDNEENSIETLVKIAEDSQAIYEFLQNAVDANADKFFVFYNEKYFAVINNGDKFTADGVESILNIAQSTKNNDEKRIGKFGVGFKLIHRLVGKSDGLKEIIKDYKGPVLFSWNQFYLQNLLNNDLKNIDYHWLFKIIFTNFPSGLNEKIKGKNYEIITPFMQEELNEMIDFIKTKFNKSNLNPKDFANGSLFFLRLGKGKNNLLIEEEQNLTRGAEYSLSILNTLYKNKNTVSEMRINNIVIKKKDMKYIEDDNFLLMFPKDQKESLKYFRNKNEKISFFKFFPMGDQRNEFNFIVHSHLFEIETNRRKIQHSPGNKEILQTIAKHFMSTLNELYENKDKNFYSILLNLYLSDLETSSEDEFIQNSFSKYLLEYIKANIPTNMRKKVSDPTQVKIIKSKLKVPLTNYNEFYFDYANYDKHIVQRAKKLLKLQEWDIFDILIYDDIEKWVHSLDFDKYEIFISELDKSLSNKKLDEISTRKIFLLVDGSYASLQDIQQNKKLFFRGIFPKGIDNKLKNLNFISTMIDFNSYKNIAHSISQDIESDYFDEIYNYAQTEMVLDIFKEKQISNFALVKNHKDNYSILPDEKNIYIKNEHLMEHLEKTYELDQMGYFLVPDEFKKTIKDIYPLEKKDSEIIQELLDAEQHEEIIDFVTSKELRQYFLNTLPNLYLNTRNKYDDNSFEQKVLKFMVQEDELDYRSKIWIDNIQINKGLRSDKINFKYGRANNEKVVQDYYDRNYDFEFTEKVQKFINENFDKSITTIFKIIEGDKAEAYQYLKNKILNNPHSKNMVNTFQRFKFILLYSLELKKNLFNDFTGIELNSGADDTYRSFYNLLDTKVNISLDQIVEMNVFTIKNIFKNSLSNEYYISDISLAIDKEKLPHFFYRSENRKVLEVYEKLGLTIDSDLEKIRKKLLSNNEIKQKELTNLKNTELKVTNTLKFLVEKEFTFQLDKKDPKYKSIQLLYKIADINYINNNYYPVLINHSSCQMEMIDFSRNITYIKQEKLKSKNKSFKKRLIKEIEENQIVYLDILDTDNIPRSWSELKENKEEKIEKKKEELAQKDKEITARSESQDSNPNTYKWMIGWKGERYVFELLLSKYIGTDYTVVWHNENAKSIKDDKGGIDIEVHDHLGKTVHNIEVKTTIKSSKKDDKLAFYMSSEQFEAATSWGRNTHLIFVTGIEDGEPKLLYMNFDNNWLSEKENINDYTTKQSH
jgi:hypothetical protein